jgi:hypothetical protein
MNILLLGDSWSYSCAQGFSAEVKNFENTLLSMGHLVFNKSRYGGSNLATLTAGETLIEHTKTFFKFDLIIWFHTELLRDSVDYLGGDYETYLNLLHRKVLLKVNRIKQKTKNTKWAIIGGHAPLHVPKDYEWADFKINDWRAELLNTKLPICHSLGHQVWLSSHSDFFGKEVMYTEQQKYDLIFNLCDTNRQIFPDGVHPSYEALSRLAKQIINHIT